MESQRFVFYLFGSYLLKTGRKIPVSLISPFSKFYRDLNISLIELRGIAFGFSCFLIDYYRNNRFTKDNYFHTNNNIKIENFTIDFEKYEQLLYKFGEDGDLEIKYFLMLFIKSMENCRYTNANNIVLFEQPIQTLSS